MEICDLGVSVLPSKSVCFLHSQFEASISCFYFANVFALLLCCISYCVRCISLKFGLICAFCKAHKFVLFLIIVSLQLLCMSYKTTMGPHGEQTR